MRIVLVVAAAVLAACGAALSPTAPGPTPSPVQVSVTTAPAAAASVNDRGCAAGQRYDALPVPLRSPLIDCVIREQVGTVPPGSLHRFYRLSDGRTLYVFQSRTAPDPRSRLVTEAPDGSVVIDGQPFQHRLLVPRPDAPPEYKPELYLAGVIKGVSVEVVLQVPEVAQRDAVLAELKTLIAGALR